MLNVCVHLREEAEAYILVTLHLYLIVVLVLEEIENLKQLPTNINVASAIQHSNHNLPLTVEGLRGTCRAPGPSSSLWI